MCSFFAVFQDEEYRQFKVTYDNVCHFARFIQRLESFRRTPTDRRRSKSFEG